MRAYQLVPLMFLTACMVGPNYHKPDISMPSEFTETKKEAEAENSPCDEDLCEWWKQLGDPFLDALLEEAARANYDLLIAIEKIEQARAQYRIERSYLWPEFDINAVATRSRNSQNFFSSSNSSSSASTATTTGGPAGGSLPPFQNFFQLGFDAIWELDFFGKFRRAKNAAYYAWEATKEDAQNVLISVLSEVAVNYVSIRALQQQIDLAMKIIRTDEEELLLTLALFEAGLDSEIQVEALLAALDSDRAALPVLETSIKQTIYALAYLLGRQPEGLAAEFKETGAIPSGIDKVPVGLPSDLLRRRPDVRSAERQLAAATEEIGVAVADLFPHVTLTGNTFSGGSLTGSVIGYESGTLNKLLKSSSNFWSVGPAIRWDAIDWGRTRANIAIQNSLQRQALLTYEQIVIASLRDVEGALVAYFDEQRRRAILAEQVTANRRSLQLTEDLYQAGLASDLSVLEARKTLLISETSLVNSQQSLTSDLIALYKALGGNWECSSSR